MNVFKKIFEFIGKIIEFLNKIRVHLTRSVSNIKRIIYTIKNSEKMKTVRDNLDKILLTADVNFKITYLHPYVSRPGKIEDISHEIDEFVNNLDVNGKLEYTSRLFNRLTKDQLDEVKASYSSSGKSSGDKIYEYLRTLDGLETSLKGLERTLDRMRKSRENYENPELPKAVQLVGYSVSNISSIVNLFMKSNKFIEYEIAKVVVTLTNKDDE